MFTLAQYVFGIGKAEDGLPPHEGQQDTVANTSASSSSSSSSATSSSASSSSSNSNCDPSTPLTPSCYEIDSPHCVQKSIEDDWILIEVGDENSNFSTSSPKKAAKNRITKKRSKSKSKSKKSEKWVLDPPECFIDKTTSKDLQRSLSTNDNGLCNSSHSADIDSKENLLIEFPSNVVFESLFVRRCSDAAAPVIQPQLDDLESVSSEAVEVVVRPVPSTSSSKKASKKSRKMEPLHNTANVLTSASVNQNKAISIVNKGETQKRKRSITRKHHERQNRVTIQRNGPIIRGKKMFNTMNGAYSCTRSQC